MSQEAHDKKVAEEISALRKEAEKKGIVVADSYNNPESIRALIDKHDVKDKVEEKEEKKVVHKK